ncbi:hypothetical protein SE17_16240 [Kouleothrix aurantiaca]|uniref:Uncharacterized protein n=1 Tax=Kouleothrix aurantiaca TaxID=186479 RepID=A0A0P9D2R7_9CHLR|nr:hypothetical protein SE17_16240 [Kouleothrix aurantiaca]
MNVSAKIIAYGIDQLDILLLEKLKPQAKDEEQRKNLSLKLKHIKHVTRTNTGKYLHPHYLSSIMQ